MPSVSAETEIAGKLSSVFGDVRSTWKYVFSGVHVSLRLHAHCLPEEGSCKNDVATAQSVSTRKTLHVGYII